MLAGVRSKLNNAEQECAISTSDKHLFVAEGKAVLSHIVVYIGTGWGTGNLSGWGWGHGMLRCC